MLFIFRLFYLCAIGLWLIFSFRKNLPPILSSIPKLFDSLKKPYKGLATAYTGLLPSVAPLFKGLKAVPNQRYPLQIATISAKPEPFKSKLLPLYLPLLGQSLLVFFPPLINIFKFSG